jgi:hypothetical protein
MEPEPSLYIGKVLVDPSQDCPISPHFLPLQLARVANNLLSYYLWHPIPFIVDGLK